MKFFAPTDTNVHIALTTGHTCVVTPEGTDIDPRFQREAIALGCVPEGVERAELKTDKPGFDRKQVIRAAIDKMVAEPKPGDFRNDGAPSAAMVSKYVGFQALRTEVDAIWGEIQLG